MNFLDAEAWRFTQVLKDNYSGLLADFEQYAENQWVQNNQPYIGTTGGWLFVPFIGKGVKFERFIEQCPTVKRLMAEIPIYDNCVFSIMGPGAEIKPHKGHESDHLRVHLGIKTTGEASITVGNETAHWQNNQVIIFDDREMHSTVNPSKVNRIVFLFDILSKDYYNNLIC